MFRRYAALSVLCGNPGFLEDSPPGATVVAALRACFQTVTIFLKVGMRRGMGERLLTAQRGQ